MTVGNIMEVPLEKIDRKADFFRFGRVDKEGELKNSIKLFGVLERPFLLKKGESFQIFSGFNRLAAVESGGGSVSAHIIDHVTGDMFVDEVGKKYTMIVSVHPVKSGFARFCKIISTGKRRMLINLV